MTTLEMLQTCKNLRDTQGVVSRRQAGNEALLKQYTTTRQQLLDQLPALGVTVETLPDEIARRRAECEQLTVELQQVAKDSKAVVSV